MSDTDAPRNPTEQLSREELMSALFANMLMQQTNMALMFLGKMPHPETGKHVTDLEMAQLFIDQLEMLEVKTKGNLNKNEEGLLKQSLTAVRMAFVQAAQEPAAPATPSPAPEAAPDKPAEGQVKPAESGAAAPDADSHKKFSKKY